LIYHFCGVFIAPASVAPSSRLSREAWRGVGHYLQFMYLNHGFHFFAPDPGAATIVTYEVLRSDGSRIRGQLPDLEQHQPRLLYHRHFMLTEFLATAESPEFAHVKPLLIRALARQVGRAHNGVAVTLVKRVHLLPAPEWKKGGMPFDAPEMFEDEPLGTFQCSDL
jgi:hypothetical protein